MLYGIGEAESSYMRGLKLGLELLGICKCALALPYVAAEPRLHKDLKAILKEYA